MRKINIGLFSFVSICVTSLVTCIPSNAVTLAGVVNQDTPTKLNISWTGNGLDNGLDDDFLNIPNLINWEIINRDANNNVQLTYLRGGAGWTGEIEVKHKTDPHPELGEKGGGATEKLPIAFKRANANKKVVSTVDHPPTHFDKYSLKYSYNADADGTFSARLSGVHTPEPSSVLGLLALGLISTRLTSTHKKR